MNKLTKFNLSLIAVDMLGAVAIGTIMYRRYHADKVNAERNDREHGKQFTCEALVNIIDADTNGTARIKNGQVHVDVADGSDALKNWENVRRKLNQRKLVHKLVPVKVVYHADQDLGDKVAVVRSDHQFATLTKYM